MPQHIRREIENLKKLILDLSAMVEENVYNSVNSIGKRDSRIAKKTIESDSEVNEMEMNIEEECLKVLALYQPVATELRFIVMLMKINADLERISDIARNIAERSLHLADKEKVDIPFNFSEMADITMWMLKKSMDAFVNQDLELAQSVTSRDDEVDEINRHMYDRVKTDVRENIANLDQLVDILCISKNLERIADHSVNIAEDIIYMISGKIVRHKLKCYSIDDGLPSNK